ncbi:hypothetical protein F8M41_003531 [Gigaspora margarita]|uniref:CCHC-type domain-containing protein n=2 Tax=Gigaspora margarita TaxID=4874 RepID=A0A8H4A673_GIGMA|nr:hypothetical protein F8M41_003531 [Gigaspora margarita]
MATKDLTKPFYYGSISESIDNFVADFEGYAAMKDWNEAKMRLVVGLYVAEPLREWVRDIVQGNTDWADVKAAILKSAKAKYDVKTNIERLMNLKLNEDESIVSYTYRFDACAKKVKTEVSNREVKRWYLRGIPVKYREKIKQRYPETYEETKEWALKIEKFEKNDEFDLKKASVVGEESTAQTDLDVDGLTNAFSELKICRVSQSSQVGKDVERIDRLESIINELTKLVKNMANKDQSNQNQPAQHVQGNWRQKQNFIQSPSSTQSNQSNPRRCYNCGQEGHMLRDCPAKILPNPLAVQNVEVKKISQQDADVQGANVRYFEITETSLMMATNILILKW